MSFIDIEDPEKREEIVRDYQRIVHEIQERNESRRSSNIHQERTLEKTFAPIIKSQKHMTEEIVKTLKNEREEIVPLEKKKAKVDKVEKKKSEKKKVEKKKSKISDWFKKT